MWAAKRSPGADVAAKRSPGADVGGTATLGRTLGFSARARRSAPATATDRRLAGRAIISSTAHRVLLLASLLLAARPIVCYY